MNSPSTPQISKTSRACGGRRRLRASVAIMRRSLLAAPLLGLAVLVMSCPAALAQNCNSAPNTGYNAAGAQTYAKWCSICGGTPTGNFSCKPGPNWGRGPANNSQPSADVNAANAAAATAAAEAEAEREREAEEQRLRDEEAERQRQAAAAAAAAAAAEAEFQRKKQEALSSMKGIAEGEFGLKDDGAGSGLKGLDDTGTGSSGLKGLGDTGMKTLPAVNTDSSVVDLSDTNLEDANKALMRHQWTMSIDQRYKDDPEVQQYIRDLWKSAASSNSDPAMSRIRSILTDQLKVAGLTEQQIHGFFQTFDTFTTGQGPIPKAWDKASKLAHEIDAAAPIEEPQRPYNEILVDTLGKSENVKARVLYMGTGPQTTDDCVLHAISDGAQVPYAQVKARLEPTLKNLAIARIEVRNNPELAVTPQSKGGTGGLNPFEEILIAKQVGTVVGVPDKSFAKAIESTGRPVITSVRIDAYDANRELRDVANHEVAVTGVYRMPDGKVYYSVMDSNLKSHPNYTAYVEKNDFEGHMLFGGGYVVVKNGTN